MYCLYVGFDYTYIHVCMYVCMCVCVCMYVYVCLYACVCVCVCMYVCMYVSLTCSLVIYSFVPICLYLCWKHLFVITTPLHLFTRASRHHATMVMKRHHSLFYTNVSIKYCHRPYRKWNLGSHSNAFQTNWQAFAMGWTTR